jgi:hypothetical protein
VVQEAAETMEDVTQHAMFRVEQTGDFIAEWLQKAYLTVSVDPDLGILITLLTPV